MIEFHEWIREIRKKLGFATAKDFHRKRLESLGMSYESYANIEAGKYLPPAEKLPGMVESLEVEDVRAFIFCYCASMMPNDLFKSFFETENRADHGFMFQTNQFNTYREKFQALMEFNRIQSKFELSEDQIRYLETDLIAWDVVNLFIAAKENGLAPAEIAEKTEATETDTLKRLEALVERRMLKETGDKRYIVTQEAFIIPRRPVANRLTQALVQREMEESYKDVRNHPYTRFRFMPISEKDRDAIEMFIDNFILESRRFLNSTGKTHYLQVLFSDRHDLQ